MTETTPPTWPIFNVHLTEQQIVSVIKHALPGAILKSSQEQGKKKSYNNRIYFLKVGSETGTNFPSEVVLKVIGRFFGANKIQNEVSCLLLLQKYCPEIPAPRVLAWSEDGSKICGIRNGVFAVLHDSQIDETSAAKIPHGWIMLTKLEGRILETSDLDPINGTLISELAAIVASWRTNIPHRKRVGNLALQPAGYTSVDDFYGLEAVVSDFLLCPTQPPHPPSTELDLQRHLLSDQLHKLRTNTVFSPLHDRVLARLETFHTKELPSLSFLAPNHPTTPSTESSSSSTTVFTQQDFAPRNILVTPSSSDPTQLHISGILDFEFSGFYPPSEEFLTCEARQSGDWPAPFFEKFKSALAERGGLVVATDPADFAKMCELANLIELAAPWWLQEVKVEDEELDKQLGDVGTHIEAALGAQPGGKDLKTQLDEIATKIGVLLDRILEPSKGINTVIEN